MKNLIDKPDFKIPERMGKIFEPLPFVMIGRRKILVDRVGLIVQNRYYPIREAPDREHIEIVKLFMQDVPRTKTGRLGGYGLKRDLMRLVRFPYVTNGAMIVGCYESGIVLQFLSEDSPNVKLGLSVGWRNKLEHVYQTRSKEQCQLIWNLLAPATQNRTYILPVAMTLDPEQLLAALLRAMQERLGDTLHQNQLLILERN